MSEEIKENTPAHNPASLAAQQGKLGENGKVKKPFYKNKWVIGGTLLALVAAGVGYYMISGGDTPEA